MLDTGMAMGIVATEELLWGGDDGCSIAAADVNAGKATRCCRGRPLCAIGGGGGGGGGRGGASVGDLREVSFQA